MVREKEKQEFEKKKFREQLESWDIMKEELDLKKKEKEDLTKKIKKLEHRLLMSEQSYQTVKKMHEKDKIFWDEQINEQRKKNEKLNMEMGNIFQNSIQNKNAEEGLRKSFNKKYKKLAEEMDLKEQNFKNKFTQSVKALEKNKSSLAEAKQKLEAKEKNLQEKMKNLEKLNLQVIELKGKESRLTERLDQQNKKYKQEIDQLKEKITQETVYGEKRIRMLESKLENLEEDNRKKQKQLFAGNLHIHVNLISLQPECYC